MGLISVQGFYDLHVHSAPTPFRLNRGVGEVNRGAVGLAMYPGAKIVWLPTFDAENQAKAFGGAETYGFHSMALTFKGSGKPRGQFTGLQGGHLTPGAKEVIDLVAEHDAVLATGRLSKEEILAVVDDALARELRKILTTHPEFTVPNLDIKAMVELAGKGSSWSVVASTASRFPGR